MRLFYVMGLATILTVSQSRAQNVVPPKTLDPATEIALIASEPELVTPVGLTVDSHSRVLVVESHTHFRPEGYLGPPADCVLQFEDRDTALPAARGMPLEIWSGGPNIFTCRGSIDRSLERASEHTTARSRAGQ